MHRIPLNLLNALGGPIYYPRFYRWGNKSLARSSQDASKTEIDSSGSLFLHLTQQLYCLSCLFYEEGGWPKRWSHTVERPEIHMPYQWCCYPGSATQGWVCQVSAWWNSMSASPLPRAHILFLRYKQLRMFARTQRMKVELSSTYWGWGIDINCSEFFCEEDWSLLPCLHFYWPSSRRHWNQSDRFHTLNITWI